MEVCELFAHLDRQALALRRIRAHLETGQTIAQCLSCNHGPLLSSSVDAIEHLLKLLVGPAASLPQVL
jgi:hypothetical protein